MERVSGKELGGARRAPHADPRCGESCWGWLCAASIHGVEGVKLRHCWHCHSCDEFHMQPHCIPHGDPEHPMLSPIASHMQPQCIPYSTPPQPISIPTASHAQPHCISCSALLHPTCSPTASHAQPHSIPCSAPLHPVLVPTVSHTQPHCIPHGDSMHPTCSPHSISYAAPQNPMLHPPAPHAQPHCVPHTEDTGQSLWDRSDDTLGMESTASSPAGAKCSYGIFFLSFFFPFLLLFFLNVFGKGAELCLSGRQFPTASIWGIYSP